MTVQEGRARAFDGTILNMKNIIGTFHPESRDRVLLFAHWDTRPFADKDSTRTREPIDGQTTGRPVGVLLEVARQLGREAADIGVDIVFFDAEDYDDPSGCLPLKMDFGIGALEASSGQKTPTASDTGRDLASCSTWSVLKMRCSIKKGPA